MLFASGRLLACGWECMDQLAAAEASCHQDAAPATALNGEPAHPCLPEIAEPHVTAAKLAAAPSVADAPLVTAFITPDRAITPTGGQLHSSRIRFESPHLAAGSVLRI